MAEDGKMEVLQIVHTIVCGDVIYKRFSKPEGELLGWFWVDGYRRIPDEIAGALENIYQKMIARRPNNGMERDER